MEILVNDLETSTISYTAPQNTISITYSVLDVLNDTYIQYDQIDAATNVAQESTISIATPAVITKNSHGLISGDAVKFSTTGALPTGINTNTTYYVKFLTANTFNIYTSSPSSLVQTTGTQSGTHKFVKRGQTLFNLSLNADTCKYDRNVLIDIQAIQVDSYSNDTLSVSIKRPYATVSEIRSYFAISGDTKIPALSDAFLQQLERKIRLDGLQEKQKRWLRKKQREEGVVDHLR